jgi:hypothetical protein
MSRPWGEGQVGTFIIDRRLTAIGGRLLLVDGDDETVRLRTVQARAGTEFIESDALGRFGRDHDQLTSYFQHERDRFRTLFAASTMTKLRVHAEDPAVGNIARAAAFWLDAADGSA